MRILKKKLGFFSKTVFLLNIVAIVALLMSYSASVINPATFWPIAFFGLAYLPILLINIGFVVYWLLRRPRHAIYSLVMIVLGWGSMNRHVTWSNNQHSTQPDSLLRVMTYNVHLFQSVHSADESIKDSVIQVVNQANPDILCMQEFQSNLTGNKKISDHLKEACGFADYYFAPWNKNDYHGLGQIIYSKYPIINAGTITQNSYGINRITFADILKESDTVRVYNVHLRSFGLQSEDKEFIQNPSASPEDETAATRRLSRKLRDAFEQRSNQAKSLAKHIQETSYTKIVLGDFNDTPMSFSVNRIDKKMNNAFRQKGNGWGVTHYDFLPILQIDYIFSDLEVLDYHIIKRRLSDHYPVWADLKL